MCMFMGKYENFDGVIIGVGVSELLAVEHIVP